MKVLIQVPESPRFAGVMRGWERALAAAGYRPRRWDAATPAFDAFGAADPDVFLRTAPPSRAVVRCVAARPRLTVIDQEEPEFGFDHLGLEPGRFDPRMACDLAYVGRHHADKARLLEAYLRPLLDCGEFRVKLFGAGAWPGFAEHLGPIEEPLLPDLHASAGAMLDVCRFRPSERQYLAMGLGRYCVPMRWHGRNPASPEEFLAAARHYLREIRPEEDERHARKRRQIILTRHTYAHRLAALFHAAGLADEARGLHERAAPDLRTADREEDDDAAG